MSIEGGEWKDQREEELHDVLNKVITKNEINTDKSENMGENVDEITKDLELPEVEDNTEPNTLN